SGFRRLVGNLDVLLLLSTVALIGFGLVMVYSSTHVSLRPFLYLRSQLLHLAFGLVLGGLLLAVDYRALAASARVLYVLNILLLGAVLVPHIGRVSLGAQRWIAMGPLGQFQPSEIAKLIIVITLAKHLTDRAGPYESLRDLVPFLA